MPMARLAVHHIIDGLIIRELSAFTDENGDVDTAGLKASVYLRLTAEEPTAARAFTAVARDAALKARIDGILRTRKANFVVGRTAKAVQHGQLRMFVRFPLAEVHQFVTKLRSHMSFKDVRPFLVYHRKLRGAHALEVKWGEWALREGKRMKLSEETPVSRIMEGEQARAS